MLLSDGLEMLLAACIGLCAASLLFYWWSRYTSVQSTATRQLLETAEDSVVFIFDDEVLLDATPGAKTLMTKTEIKGSDWDRLMSILSADFPNLPQHLSDLAEFGRKTLLGDSGRKRIEAEFWNGVARLTLVPQDHDPQSDNSLIMDAMEHELSVMRSLAEDSPQLIWRTDLNGALVWANKAYLDLADLAHPIMGGALREWPPATLFTDVALPAGKVPVVERHWLNSDGRIAPQCFEVTSVQRGDTVMHFAVDITAVVDAQDTQNKFVQTLTKTFAQLSVGLSVFDRNRQLVLFNPALVDLLHLPAEYLISRPRLGDFLDRLREARMIPEPKDYASWRGQIEALESAAADGSYSDVWDLPSGLTYRVTGRPHPDGAIAFLFEDISEELSLTRRFRSQIDLNQAVFDSLKEAVAVFSPSGEMLFSNRAYRTMWRSDGHLSLTSVQLSDELAIWEGATAPSPVWQRVSQAGSARTWSEGIVRNDGRHVHVESSLLPSGEQLFRFLPTDVSTSEDASASEREVMRG